MRLPSIDRRRIVGALLALVAAALVLVATRPGPTVDILVATRDLAAGWPVPPDAMSIRAVGDARGLVQVTDAPQRMSLRAPVAAGEPLLASQVVETSAVAIPDGVMGLDLTSAQGVLGRLVPGDRVDVYVSRFDDDSTTRVAVEIPVVDIVESAELGGARSVQVLVGVDETIASSVAAAARAGDIHLVRVGR